MTWMTTAGVATFALVGLGALVSIPPAGVAFDDACRPQGFRAWVSAKISGEEFWESQLGAAKWELISLGQAPAGDNTPWTGLANSFAVSGATRHLLKGKVDPARIAVLTRCERVIAGR